VDSGFLTGRVARTQNGLPCDDDIARTERRRRADCVYTRRTYAQFVAARAWMCIPASLHSKACNV
jgi:hypothetical protein